MAENPSTPAPPVTDPSPTPAAPDQPGGPPQEGSVDATPAWKSAATREEALAALLGDESLPLDALVQHPRVSGVIGTHAKVQAQRQRQQEADQEAEKRRREAAAKGDYWQLGQDVAAQYAPNPQAELQQMVASEARDALAPILASLPEKDQQELSGKTYEGSFGQGLRGWVEDVVSARTAAELDRAVEREIKKRDLVPRGVAEAERVSGEGSPEMVRSRPMNGHTWQSVTEVEAAFLQGEATAADVRAARSRLPYRR